MTRSPSTWERHPRPLLLRFNGTHGWALRIWPRQFPGMPPGFLPLATRAASDEFQVALALDRMEYDEAFGFQYVDADPEVPRETDAATSAGP